MEVAGSLFHGEICLASANESRIYVCRIEVHNRSIASCERNKPPTRSRHPRGYQAPPSSSSDRYKDGEGVDRCVCYWDGIAKGAGSSWHCLTKFALALMWCSWPRTSIIPVQSSSYAVSLEHGFCPYDQYRNLGGIKGEHDKCV